MLLRSGSYESLESTLPAHTLSRIGSAFSGHRKGGSEEPPPGRTYAIWPSWLAWPTCSRRFARCRVVDLAKVVGLDRKRLVLHAVSRVRLGLDLAFNNYQLPSLEGGGGLRERSPNLNLEPIGVLVLGAATVFPCARRSSPSGGPNQVWREAAAHQRVGRRAKTAAAGSRAQLRYVALFFASSGGSSSRRNCGRSRSGRHCCPHSRRIYTAQIDDFFCPSFKDWSATK
jgi:hypothetical protein